MSVVSQAEKKLVPDNSILSPDDIDLQLPPIKEPPLVTFAVFAYNQEKYIREAVEGVFAQTYEPLEIILSDDCSTDRTFEIMQEMTAAYHGPHRIIVRRNAFNMGTALHVQLAFADSSGVLFVVAAGDDISTPARATSLYSSWQKAGWPPGAIHSAYETFREGDSKVVARFPAKRRANPDDFLQGYAHSQWLPAAAPTCAYTRDVFERFGPLLGGSIIEDAPLMLRSALIGRFITCDEPLVRQRLHDNNSGTGYMLDAPARWNRFVQSKVIAFRNMQIDLNCYQGAIDPKLRNRVEKQILAVLRSTSGLMLSETTPLSWTGKTRLAARLVFAPAVARSFRLRVEYALSFFGFNFHTRFKKRLRDVLSDREA